MNSLSRDLWTCSLASLSAAARASRQGPHPPPRRGFWTASAVAQIVGARGLVPSAAGVHPAEGPRSLWHPHPGLRGQRDRTARCWGPAACCQPDSRPAPLGSRQSHRVQPCVDSCCAAPAAGAGCTPTGSMIHASERVWMHMCVSSMRRRCNNDAWDHRVRTGTRRAAALCCVPVVLGARRARRRGRRAAGRWYSALAVELAAELREVWGIGARHAVRQPAGRAALLRPGPALRRDVDGHRHRAGASRRWQLPHGPVHGCSSRFVNTKRFCEHEKKAKLEIDVEFARRGVAYFSCRLRPSSHPAPPRAGYHATPFELAPLRFPDSSAAFQPPAPSDPRGRLILPHASTHTCVSH